MMTERYHTSAEEQRNLKNRSKRTKKLEQRTPLKVVHQKVPHDVEGIEKIGAKVEETIVITIVMKLVEKRDATMPIVHGKENVSTKTSAMEFIVSKIVL